LTPLKLVTIAALVAIAALVSLLNLLGNDTRTERPQLYMSPQELMSTTKLLTQRSIMQTSVHFRFVLAALVKLLIQ